MLLFLEMIPYMVIFIFGIVIGSFLNVCIYRMPLHESIITAPSHCMTCGGKLHWYDMVPVFSWLCLGGRCRNCGTKISVQYPVIEALNGVLYVDVFAVNGLNGVSGVYCLMTSALLTLSLIDWRIYEIPLPVNGFLFVLGIVAAGLDSAHLLSHVIGALCVSLVLELVFVISGGRAIGGGDVKLMAACGLILGWKRIILAFVLGCIIGSAVHLIRIRVSGAGHMLAMGPYLSAGIFLAALWGEQWINWYMSICGL